MSKEDIFKGISQSVSTRFGPSHNALLSQLVDLKIECYRRFGLNPVSYYSCFDRIERQALKDGRFLQEESKGLQD